MPSLDAMRLTAPWNAAAESSDQLVGRRIGAYKVLQQIGRGGMGTIYLADRADAEFHKRVALKVIKRGMDTEAILRRFKNERQILACLEHPNIARLLDGGTTEDGLPYFVMEFIQGSPICEYCDTQKLTIDERLKLFLSICAAVDYAHRNFVVHRDIKPSNILVTVDGVPKLLDFGIAKLLKPELWSQTVEPTALAARPMTPEYASPEQIRGDPITASSDVYSLGVLLYELLTGHRPYRLKNRLPEQVARAVSELEPEKPSSAVARTEVVATDDSAQANTITPDLVSRARNTDSDQLRRRLSGDLDSIILKAIRKEPHRRYGSASELAEDIRRHVDGLPVGARKGAAGYHAAKFVQRNKYAIGLVLLFTAMFAITGLFFFRSQRDRRSDQRAEPTKASSPRADLSSIQQVTQLNGCVYAPLFVDPRTVVFDLSQDSAPSFHRIALGNGKPERLTSGSSAQFATRGRTPDEIIYYRGEGAAARLAYLNWRTGEITLTSIASPAAVFARGALYYARSDGAELRRAINNRDESIASLPHHQPIKSVTASPDQRWIAILTEVQASAKLCFVDLASAEEQSTVTCNGDLKPITGRPGSFAPDSTGFYYATTAGIRRFDLFSKDDQEVVPGVYARGGLAVSPDGKTLVFSDCQARGPLLDVSVAPPQVVVNEDLPREPNSSANGSIVYVRERKGKRILVVRDEKGLSRELTSERLGDVHYPALDRTGRSVAFKVDGSNAGLYVTDVEARLSPEPLIRGEVDFAPVWTADGRIAFTRWDELGNPYVFVIAATGGEVKRAHERPRRTIYSSFATGELLLNSRDKSELYLWNPTTGQERQVPLPAGASYVMSAAPSLDGRFIAVQTGHDGRTIWKVFIDGSNQPPEKVFEAPPGQSMSSAIVLANGHVVVGPRTWRGELHAVLAQRAASY